MARSGVLAVDPGVHGGVALVHGPDAYEAWPIPGSDVDRWQLVSSLARKARVAVFEHVWSSPQQGVRSAFTFGDINGFLRASLLSGDVPLHLVRPTVWQAGLGIPVSCKGKERKMALLGVAQRVFPGFDLSKTKSYSLAVCDALLLADYGRRFV